MGGRLAPAHLALPLTDRLMRDVCSIVFVRPSTVDHGRHHGAGRRRVAAQLVRDQPTRFAALSCQQLTEESCGRAAIAPRLHEDVDYVAVFVHGTPQILLPPLVLHEQLVQIPGVAHAAPAAPQAPSVVEPKRPTPLSNCLVRHGDTPFSEEILDISDTQAETVSRPGESHPQPLVERYVNLSAHTAPIRRTHLSSRSASAQTVQGGPWPSVPSIVPLWSSSRESGRTCA